MRIPIRATARVPIKQAGYISATSDTVQILSCEKQPVHTFGSAAVVANGGGQRRLRADFVVKVGFDLSDEDVLVFAGGQSGTF